MTAIGHLAYATINSTDPRRLADFYGALLDLEVGWEGGAFIALKRPAEHAATLAFQRVDDPADRSRAHVDIHVPDVATAVARVLELGGSEVAKVAELGLRWRVMADPDGNHFCLLPETAAAAEAE